MIKRLPLIAPPLPHRGAVELGAMSKAKVVALLKARFPALKLSEVRDAAAEALEARSSLGAAKGKVLSPMAPHRLVGDVLTLSGRFEQRGVTFDFHVDYRLGPEGQFALVRSHSAGTSPSR